MDEKLSPAMEREVEHLSRFLGWLYDSEYLALCKEIGVDGHHEWWPVMPGLRAMAIRYLQADYRPSPPYPPQGMSWPDGHPRTE